MLKKNVRNRTFVCPLGGIIQVESGFKYSYFHDIATQTGFVVPNKKIPTSLDVLRYLKSITGKNWQLHNEFFSPRER